MVPTTAGTNLSLKISGSGAVYLTKYLVLWRESDLWLSVKQNFAQGRIKCAENDAVEITGPSYPQLEESIYASLQV